MCYIILHENIIEIATISSIDEQKTSITRVTRTTRRERQEEVTLVSFDSFPTMEDDLKYSRKIDIEKKYIYKSQTNWP
jgi:hypothetical protein